MSNQEFAVHIGQTRYVFKILVKKRERKILLEELGVEGNIKKKGRRMWAQFICLSTGTGSRFL